MILHKIFESISYHNDRDRGRDHRRHNDDDACFSYVFYCVFYVFWFLGRKDSHAPRLRPQRHLDDVLNRLFKNAYDK